MITVAAIHVFHWPVRVYWEDTDAGGVVYHASYLRFLERARAEWLRALGFSQQRLRKDEVVFAVRSIQVEYFHPARLDDVLTATIERVECGRASLRFRQQLQRGNEVLTEAKVRVACLTASGFRPRSLPEEVMRKIMS